jgi:hypothetical protein
MYRVDLSAVDENASYVTLANNRGADGAMLIAAQAEVMGAYGDFQRLVPAGLLPGSLVQPAPTRVALHDNYDFTQVSRSHEWLRSAVLQRAFHARCPYCDSGQATTLDHYLPRSWFPEFSILSTNLVPACHPCNTKRGDALLNAAGSRFWNAYFDPIPDQPVLFVDLVTAGPDLATVFAIRNPYGADPHLFGQLEFMFTKLKLATYFGNEASIYLHGISDALSGQYQTGGEVAVRDHLAIELATLIRRRGRNTWMAALLESLVHVADFTPGCFDALVRVAL